MCMDKQKLSAAISAETTNQKNQELRRLGGAHTEELC